MVHLVPAVLSDLAHVMRLMEAFHLFDHQTPFDRAAANQTMTQLIVNAEIGRLWLITANLEVNPPGRLISEDKIVGNEIVGYVAVTFSLRVEVRGRSAFVDEFYIDQPFRGRGIGMMAIAQLQQRCREMNIAQLQLEVLDDNLRAQSFYTRTGFVLQPRTVWTAVL